MLAWLSILAYRNGTLHRNEGLGDKLGRVLPGADVTVLLPQTPCMLLPGKGASCYKLSLLQPLLHSSLLREIGLVALSVFGSVRAARQKCLPHT